jgi:predicted enzyme related to lactoylglutathione lyase
MLRKIDCVMVRVPDMGAAAYYYVDVFGMRILWQAQDSIGLGFPETDAEIVLHEKPDLPHDVEVHYLVDDVITAVAMLAAKGCSVVVEPFDIAIGKCAVIRDPFGVTLCILDMTTGPRS